MKTIILFLLPLCFILSGCKTSMIGFFETNPRIPEPDFKMESITIAFRSAVEDSFSIQSPVIGKTIIYDFKKTLSVAFRNTFGGSFKSFSQYNNFSSEGISIVVSEMKPIWYENLKAQPAPKRVYAIHTRSFFTGTANGCVKYQNNLRVYNLTKLHPVKLQLSKILPFLFYVVDWNQPV